MNLLKALLDLIFYSNLWIACCALAMVLQTQYILVGSFNYTPLSFLVFFSTLFLYALHRIVGISKVHDFIEDFERYKVIAKFRHHIKIYAFLAAVGGAISFYYVSLPVKIALIAPGVIAFAYVIPFLKGRKRLRDFNHIKIFLIAIVWAFVSVLLPQLEMASTQQEFSFSDFRQIPLWLMALEKAVFIFTITLPFDIRDLKVDAHSGVRTLPALLGVRKTQYLAYTLIFVSILLSLLNYQLAWYSSSVLAALILSYFITALVIYFTDRYSHDYFYTGLVDGLMLVQSLLVLLMFYF